MLIKNVSDPPTKREDAVAEEVFRVDIWGLLPVSLVGLYTVVQGVAGEIADYRPQKNSVFGLVWGLLLLDGGLWGGPRWGRGILGGWGGGGGGGGSGRSLCRHICLSLKFEVEKLVG